MTHGEAFPGILAAAQEGAQWAWAAIYNDLAGPVTGYLTSRGSAEPDDLVSETFLHVARGIHSFAGSESDFRSWVFVIAHRRLQDERRATSRRPATVPLEGADAGVETVRIGTVQSAESAALGEMSMTDVAHALENLTTDQRDVIMLRVVGDLSLVQAAEVMGKPVGSIKSLQRRALAALSREISPSP